MDGLARNRAAAAFERRVARALGARVGEGATLLVACSGGPDSTAALAAAARAAAAAGGAAVAAHFDHGVRPASEADADRACVEAVAERLGVPVLAGAARRGEGGAAASEAASREARYRWLAEAAREAGAAACATGHTLDDQAETVLLRLVRGSGLAGAAAMSADAPWPVADAPGGAPPGGAGAPRLLRPLLGVRRAEAAAYLEALGLARAGLTPRDDPTNASLAHARNRVRLRVLPELRALNPRAAEALARFAARARRDGAALDAWAAREAASLLRAEGGAASLDRRALAALPEAVALRVVRLAAEAAGVGMDAEQAERALALARRSGARLGLRGGSARAAGGALLIAPDGVVEARDAT